MKKEYEPLFTPWKIGNVEIPNRIVQTSMGGTSLFGWLEPCHFDKEAAHHILGRAQDGVGLVLPGMQCVRDTMGRRWLYQNKKMFKDLAEWMPEFHKTGSKLFIQLAGGFGRSMAINDMFVKMLENKAFGAVSKPFVDIEYCCASAGETPNRWYPSIKSRMMTIEEIQEMVEAFAKTAKLCKDAGVDGVEIHAVHEGYLLDQFTIANMNYRTDQYGGSFENRFRFPVEIVQAIKRECGQDFPVALRYSVVSKTKGWLQGAQPGEEFEEFGRDMAESEKAIKYLGDMGYDMFNCDNGTYDAWYWAHPPVYMPDNCNYEDVAHIKNFTDKPVVCAGKMDIKFAAEKIKEGKIDALGIARQNLVDPDWVTKLREGREEEIKPCIRCHNACFNFAKSKHTANTQPLFDSLQLARCALTPSTMQHNKYKIVPTNKPKKVAIVGAGFGGLEAALVLKKRGHQPVVFEKSDKMFGLYNTASAMSFKDADKQLMQWYERELKKWDIDVRLNSEVKDITSLLKAYDDVIVSIGTFPKSLNIKGFDKTITFTDLLIGPKKDEYKKIVFLGGGLSSCEAAYDAVLAGKKPVVVEFLDDLIVAPGTCLANSSFLREALPFKGVPVHLRSSVTEIGDGYCMIKNFETGEEWKEECDCVVNGIGFVPNDQFASVKAKNLHRVGTCVKWGALREVIWSAWDVAMKI
ncbi:MAG: FAD-dependent oxidoreductase [Mogibacterium sp.]|nr:FAD-dependent oxidoreductase [Mogibacterium sp.]MBR4091266.1 FAD-dependent oxidoreductase [Mogibacterium sp.]